MPSSRLHALLAGSLAIAALTTTTTAGIHAQPQDKPPNLLPNGSFERGPEGWVSPDGATLDAVDNPVHLGDASARVTANGAGKFTLMTEYWRVPTEPLAGYTLRVWLYADADDPEDPANSEVLEVVAGLEFLDAEGARVGDLATQRLANPAAAWQLVEVGTATAPPGAVYARVSLTAEAAGAGATFYVDSAELTASAPPVEPTATPPPNPIEEPPPVDESAPTFFASLTNGNFELPETTPFGWLAHAGDASIVPALEGRPRVAALRSEPGATAWLQQSVAVGGGRWYEAAGWLRPGANADRVLISVAWYASEDASGDPLSSADSDALRGAGGSSATVSTGPILAPDDARSAQLRIMLRPTGESRAVLHADDVSFARTAPPAPASTVTRPGAPSPAPDAIPTFFVALTNGDFELPGDTPYGWRAHAGAVFVASAGGSRAITLTSRGRATAWLHQSFAIEAGRWYEASGRLQTVSNAALARIRVAWYASDDASGAQLSTADSDELSGVSDSFAAVSSGAIRAPEDARSAELRIMLRPAGATAATLRADDVSFARIAPPEADVTPATPTPEPSLSAEATPSFFAALTNGDFELPGDTPYGWLAHAGDALVATEGGSRAIALTSRGAATAWLHQSFAVEGGRWYEASGRLRTGSNAGLARVRVAWYASADASGAQLATTDSEEVVGAGDAFAAVSSGAIRAPDGARSAQLRIMLRPAGDAPAVLHADDVSFARTAPPPAPTAAAPEAPTTTPEAAPSFFPTLTNGDFELPGETPYGWRAHAGDALVASEGGSRAVAITSRGSATAWLHQSFAVEGGRWYEVGGRLRPGSNASLARIRIAWYASEDASGAQLSTADSAKLSGVGDSFSAVSTGTIRAPDDARSAQLRIMLRPAGEAPAVLHADDVSFAQTTEPPPAPTATPPAPGETPSGTPSPEAAARPTAAPATSAPVATAAVATPTLEPYDARSASAILLRITELLPDPLQSGADAEYEWIEVGNVGMAAVSLGGLFLADNHGRIPLPDLTLPPAGALVVAGRRADIGDAIALRRSGGLFNGLGNSGDRVALATAAGAIIDALSYGNDDSADQPPLKAPAPGRSLQRRFDSAGRFMDAAVAEQPSPGRIEAPTAGDAATPAEPAEPAPTPATTGGLAGAEARTTPSSVESLRRQLDDAADANRTAWIVLVAIAAVALVAAAAHRARELRRAPPPARRAAAPRRKRRWRRYASGAQVRRQGGPNRQ